MSYLIGGFAVLVGLLLAARWFAYADIKSIKKVAVWVGSILLVLLGLFFVLSGKLAFALMSLPALWPLIRLARSLSRQAKNFQRMASAAPGGGGDGTTEAETHYLKMVLDHATGAMSGTVIRGNFIGKSLDDLSLEDIIQLMQDASNDPETQQILEAYLDRMRPNWHDEAEGFSSQHSAGAQASSASSGPMTRDEALAILGLEAGATAGDIKEAYQRIISTIHPDKGGSDYLAAKVNAAKDVLLNA